MFSLVIVLVVLAVVVVAAIVTAAFATRGRPRRRAVREYATRAAAEDEIRERLTDAVAARSAEFLIVEEQRAATYVQFALPDGRDIVFDRPRIGVSDEQWSRCATYCTDNGGGVETTGGGEDAFEACVLPLGRDVAAAARSAVEVLDECLATPLPWRLRFETGS